MAELILEGNSEPRSACLAAGTAGLAGRRVAWSLLAAAARELAEKGASAALVASICLVLR